MIKILTKDTKNQGFNKKKTSPTIEIEGLFLLL
jgi:hypothetical protein